MEEKSETKKCNYCKVFLPIYKFSLNQQALREIVK